MRDKLLKNNIITADKAVIDIGTNTTKILSVHYTAKEIEIDDAEIVSSGAMNAFNFVKFANRINTVLKGKKRKDIILSLPSNMTESKIVSVKNKNSKDTEKAIEKHCKSFGRTSPLTHVVNSVRLGKREEQGDTVTYYLISAVPKTTINEFIEAFADLGMKITRVVSSQYNQICLSKVYSDEYENTNRIFVDFGHKESRVTVFADNIAVYSRTINVGFLSYVDKIFKAQDTAGMKDVIYALLNVGEEKEKDTKKFLFGIEDIYFEGIKEINQNFFSEFSRILDMCSNNDIDITKVYVSGYILDGFIKNFSKEIGIRCESVNFDDGKKARNGIVLDIDTEAELEERYSNAIGLAFCPLL